jgi:hypothetical protein
MMRDEKPQPQFCTADVVGLGASSPAAEMGQSNWSRSSPQARWHQPEIQAIVRLSRISAGARTGALHCLSRSPWPLSRQRAKGGGGSTATKAASLGSHPEFRRRDECRYGVSSIRPPFQGEAVERISESRHARISSFRVSFQNRSSLVRAGQSRTQLGFGSR